MNPLNFGFFAGFPYFWWYKMLGPMDSVFSVWDERFVKDRTKAASNTFQRGFLGIFLASVAVALMFTDPNTPRLNRSPTPSQGRGSR